MKKIVLCAAVSAICAAPMAAMAEADFYGQLRLSLDSVDMDTAAGSTLQMTNMTSLFGFKAKSEGDGVKAFVHMQTGAQADGGGAAFASRFYFGGLEGDFGKVAYGRMTNAYKFAGFAMDPFYNHTSAVAGSIGGATVGVSGGGATYGLSPASNGFTNNALQYSKAIGDVKVNVGLYIDDGTEDDHGTNIGAEYNKGGIKAGVQLASNGKTAATLPNIVADGDAVRVYGSYKSGAMTVAASFETVDETATTDTSYMFLVGKYKVSAETEAAVTFGSVGDGALEGTGITAGVFQTVAPKTQLFASMSTVSLDTTGAAEPSVISIGAIHKF